MFKLTKMTKKRQNMAKMLEFKYFRHFGSPRGHLKAKNNILNYFLCLFRCFLTEQFIKYWLSMNLGFPVYHLCKKTWKSPLPPNHLAEGTVNLQYMYPSGHWCQMSKTKRPRSVYKNDTIQTPLDKTNYWWLLEWDVRMKDFHFFGLNSFLRVKIGFCYMLQNISRNTSKWATFISQNYFVGKTSDWYLLPGGGGRWQ